MSTRTRASVGKQPLADNGFVDVVKNSRKPRWRKPQGPYRRHSRGQTNKKKSVHVSRSTSGRRDSVKVGYIQPRNVQRVFHGAPQKPFELQSSPGASVSGASGVEDSSVQNTLQSDVVELQGTETCHTGIKEKTPCPFDNLTEDVVLIVLSRLNLRDVFRVRAVNKQFNALTRLDSFYQLRKAASISEGAYSPMTFTIDIVGKLQWLGYDSGVWRRLPTLECIPTPAAELFKDYLVAGDGALLCVNVEKPPKPAKLIMCNPVTNKKKVLPPLLFQLQHPVLMHVKILDDNTGYEVTVAGSSSIGTESLSLKTAVYSSKTGTWVEKGDLPGPEFGLNEYQNGAYYKDDSRCLEFLLCVAVLEGGGKGVIVYDMKLGHWRSGIIQIPILTGETGISIIATSHILECGGSIYLFSEQEYGKEVSFCIHKLHIDPPEGQEIWEEKMNLKRKGTRGLLVYPEFTCVPVSDHEICIFNTVENTMEIYDTEKGFMESKKIGAPEIIGKSFQKRFHTLNPLGFVFRPDFNAEV